MLKAETLEALRPYQAQGVEWMGKHGSYLLADDVGLGKSLQVLCDFANTRRFRPEAKMLLVASNQVIQKWGEYEIPRWTTASVAVATGTAEQRRIAIEADTDITVIAYDNLDRELAALNAQKFYYLAFDEAHNIKNSTAKRTKAAFSLRGARRGMITATPMLNRVDELWSLLFMISPAEFGNRWQFLNRYAVFGGYENRQIIGVQNAAELRARMAPHMLRRTKAEVMSDLPAKFKITAPCELTPVQRKMYETALNELRIELDGRNVAEFDNPMTRFLKLRQIIGTPHCVGGPDDSGTLDMVMEYVDEIGPDHKIVIFTQWLGVIDALRQRLAKAKVSAAHIQGQGMTSRARHEVVTAFQTGREPRVLVASYHVAREGIDLYAADYGIKVDKLWSPKLDDQAEGRLHRSGQTSDVTFVEVMPNNTVASRVEAILATKQATDDAVFTEDAFVASLGNHWQEILQ